MESTYLTTEVLSRKIKYDARTMRERLKDRVLNEGVHYVRPCDGRKILYVWERIEHHLKLSASNSPVGANGSQSDIHVSQPVFEALKNQFQVTGKVSEYAFGNPTGQPLDNKNFSDRIWYPLLRHLGLEKRRTYQMRHTAAMLGLASCEAPEWIGRQLGHTSTEMLSRVYSRYVPNLTRQDGSAMERLQASQLSQGALVKQSRLKSGYFTANEATSQLVPKPRGLAGSKSVFSIVQKKKGGAAGPAMPQPPPMRLPLPSYSVTPGARRLAAR